MEKNVLFFNHLIILLCLASINSLPALPSLPSLDLTNSIMIRVNGSGKVRIINNEFFNKLYPIYTDGLTQKVLTSTEIVLDKADQIIGLKFNQIIVSCTSMFLNCTNITEIDLRNFISTEVTSINNMFSGCTSLKLVKFREFQTSKVNYMEGIFKNCKSLQSIDVSCFNTTLVTHFHYMFYGCESLKYLDVSNFNTTSMDCIHNMFNGCTSLTSIKLFKFENTNTYLLYNAFTNCKNLISLDLSSLQIILPKTRMKEMFYGCEKLEFVNLKKATISNVLTHQDMIKNTAKNIVFCVEEDKTPILDGYMKANNCSKKTSDCENWKNYQKKYIPESGICIDECRAPLSYEYLGKCYEKCPNGTVEVQNECVDCLKLGKCVDIPPTEIKKSLKENILSYVNASNVIAGSNFLAAVLSSDDINHEELFKKGMASFDLGNCTDSLKDYYDIKKKESLIILNTQTTSQKNESDKNNVGQSSLSKNNQLEVFDKAGNELDLTVCNEEINFIQSLANEGMIDLNMVKIFVNHGIDVFDSSEEFFNDLCYYYDSDIDIPMKDRRSLIFQNIKKCQIGCEYGGVDSTLMAVNCKCNTSIVQKDKINITDEFEEKGEVNFQNIKDSILSNLFSFNLEVLRCYNLVIHLKILVRNYGFYSLLLMLILQIIFFIVYLVKKLNPVKNFMISLNKQKSNDKKKEQNKANITIIKSKKNKNSNKSKFIKTKVQSFPPKKGKNVLNTNIVMIKKNNKKQVDILKSQSNAFSSKNDFTSEKRHNVNIYNQKNLKKMNNNMKDSELKMIDKRKGEIENNNLNLKSDNKNDKELNLNKDEAIKLLKNIYDLQNVDYEEAIKYDKRGYFKMYWGCLVDTQVIFGTFCSDNHLDLFAIKLSFFIFTFQISFFLNALFYTDEYISKSYNNNGVLDFVSGLPKSIYSYAATLVTTNLLRMLSTSKNELLRLIIEKLKYKYYINLIQVKLDKLRKKLIIYYIIVFIFSCVFFYYVSSFCAVYRNSQKYWFLGCLESLAMDTGVSFIICIFLALFRYISIKRRIKYFYTLTNVISTFL